MTDTMSVSKKNQRCSNCRFWRQTTWPEGECLCLPPVFVGPDFNVVQRRPIVKDDEICMYWDEAPNE